MSKKHNDAKTLEFRVPISPTSGFFSQVRLFNFALRRLGGTYQKACLRIVVGDRCDLDEVQRQNRWSENDNIVWERVPDALFDEAGIWGTANWRLNLPSSADVIILSDADSVLLRDIDPLLDEFVDGKAIVRGHMAHYPPPVGQCGELATSRFWPEIFTKYGAKSTFALQHYSMDADQSLPLAPPYFNLGFVAMNGPALFQFGQDIHWTESWIRNVTGSHMRCQIALTLIACRRQMDFGCVSAAYNAANDPVHLAVNKMTVSDIRVLHYLREVEFQRENFLQGKELQRFLDRTLENETNIALQSLVREYHAAL